VSYSYIYIDAISSDWFGSNPLEFRKLYEMVQIARETKEN